MSQHDFEIANQTFPSFRSDLNNALQAIVGLSSGATAPSTTFAYQLWYDSTADELKIRNAADDAWITLFTFNQGSNSVEVSGEELVDDTTPQLGGDLDLNNSDITGTGNINITGSITVDGGTVKLDGNYPTGTNNVALGNTALDSVQTGGDENTAIGSNALTATTTGDQNTGVGRVALSSNTTGSDNTAVGTGALRDNTTANNNTAVGSDALKTNTTGQSNTALGTNALDANTTASNSTAIGYNALTTATGQRNTAVGQGAGESVTTGTTNTLIGRQAGYLITTGADNTVIGAYSGNGGGLDIRTSSNNIVLSDGAGNPELYYNHGSLTWFSPSIRDKTTASSANMRIDGTSGAMFRSTSSQRYKNTINDATHGLTELLTLRPVTYKGNNDGDIIFGGLIAEEVHTAGLTEFVEYTQDDDGNDQPESLYYGNMVSLCIKAIQELKAELDAAKTRIETLENA